MTLVYLRVEQNLSITQTIKPIVNLLNNTCKGINENNKPLLDLMASFVDSLNDIIDLSKKSRTSTCAFLGTFQNLSLFLVNEPVFFRSKTVMAGSLEVA